MRSSTENMIPADAGFMEFQLEATLGYQEWRGFFGELGVKGCLFNGYLIQSPDGTTQISTTPVQVHVYPHSLYLSPPFEQETYYIQLERQSVRQSKVYFRIPPDIASTVLDGHKPGREDLYAVDIWYEPSDADGERILTLVYEATVATDRGEYQIKRFEAGQLYPTEETN